MDTATLATVSVHQRDERPDYRQIGRDGLKGLLKMQSVLLDFYAEQNAIAFKMVRERVGAAPSAPSTALIDSIEEIVENIVAAQKSLVDMGTRRIERGPRAKDEERAPKRERRGIPRVPVVELLRRSLEGTIEAQREILALIEKQSKLGVETADQFTRTRTGRSLGTLAAKAKESIDNVIESQRNLVDIAAKRGKDSIELLAKQDEGAIPEKLARHAEEGIDSLRRTQEKLIAIASDLNDRAYSEISDDGQPEDVVSLSNFAQRLEEGIERAVKAQHEWLDAGVRAVKRRQPESN